jgi:hypothetical protein
MSSFRKQRSLFVQFSLALAIAALVGAAAGAAPQQAAPQAPASPHCKVDGQVKSGTTPVPGTSVLIYVGTSLKAATSADMN